MYGRLTKIGDTYGLPMVGIPPIPVDIKLDDGRTVPRSVFDKWNGPALQAAGLCRVVETAIPDGEQSTGYIETLLDGVVTRHHATEPIPLPDWDAIDTARLNAALAEECSVFRALAELFLEQINNLRAEHRLAAFTKAQFVAALKAKMRTA